MTSRIERRQERAARERALLTQRCAENGVRADAAVAAFSGLYPFFEGQSNWGLLFTRWRVLVLRHEDVHAYTAYSGPVPIKLLASGPASALEFGRELGNYARVCAAGRTYWIKRADVPAVAAWRSRA